VELDQLPATIRCHDLIEGVFRVEDIAVTARYLNHTALTLGYRLECDGATVVYSCDHEPHSRALASSRFNELSDLDRSHATFFDGADLLIHDAQYTTSEYPGKIGWGHSTAEYAVTVARLANVRRLALTHHDPTRSDAAIEAIVERLRKDAELPPPEIFAAAEGQEIELVGRGHASAGAGTSATADVAPALAECRVLLVMTTAAKIKMFSDILITDGVAVSCATIDRAGSAAERLRPSVVILEDLDAVDITASGKRLRDSGDGETPVVLVTSRDDDRMLAEGGFVDRLLEPFKPSYARARVRAAIMRRASRWQAARKPEDEGKRLAGLRRLGLLDTPPEERLDRIIRVAAAAFYVPVALITLIDAERQWFKSACGFDARETGREESFCAHTILGPDILVVPDTLSDDRFAENPLVVGPPHIRFYAGHPLVMPEGISIGTLCIIDNRPRDLDLPRLVLLKDLAQLTVEELKRGRPPAAVSTDRRS
jgi:CheY-like chemotaxis protein